MLFNEDGTPKGRKFNEPPRTFGVGRAHQDIIIGDPQEYLNREHVFEPRPTYIRNRYRHASDSDFGNAPEPPVDYDKPWKVGRGPVIASTCVDVQLWPAHKYDVNGYYHTLGVSPWAAKAEIRQAYQSVLDSGQNLIRATYVFKQLINADIRRAYDAQPAGEIFIDSWEMERILAEAKAEAIRRRMEAGLDTSDIQGNDLAARNIMDENGWDIFTDQAAKPDLDIQPKRLQNTGWQFASYRWKSTYSDTKKLSEWQGMLISALAQQQARLPLVVGLHRSNELAWRVHPVGELFVAFLRDTATPSMELATKCAAMLVHLHNTTPKALLTKKAGLNNGPK